MLCVIHVSEAKADRTIRAADDPTDSEATHTFSVPIDSGPSHTQNTVPAVPDDCVFWMLFADRISSGD